MRFSGTSGPEQSGAITRQDLQKELEHFASAGLQRELQELGKHLEQILDEKFQKLNDTFCSLQRAAKPSALKQSPSSLPIPEHGDERKGSQDFVASIAVSEFAIASQKLKTLRSVDFATPGSVRSTPGSAPMAGRRDSARSLRSLESATSAMFNCPSLASTVSQATENSYLYPYDPLAADDSPRNQPLTVRKFPKGGATCTSKILELLEDTAPLPGETEGLQQTRQSARVSTWSRTSIVKPWRRSYWQTHTGGKTRKSHFAQLSAEEDVEWTDEVIGQPNCVQIAASSDLFNSSVFGITVFNLMFIAFQTDYMARNWATITPFWFKLVEAFFCIVFTLELIIRVAASGLKYFGNAGNLFDVFMVALQILETYLAFWSCLPHLNTTQFRVLRLVRLFRMIRITRVLRLVNQVKELRLLLSATGETLRPLAFMLLPLAMISIVFAMILTELATEYKLSDDVDPEVVPLLETYYGSVDQATLALFQVISGGIEWRKLMVPLLNYASPWVQIFFVCYVAFTVLGMMHVIMGIFVDSVSRAAEHSKKRTLVESMKALFEAIDTDKSGTVEFHKFEAQMDNPQMRAYLKEIDFDQEQALELFRLLDVEGSGSITPDALLSGCLMLAGPAKAVDLAILLKEFREFFNNWSQHSGWSEDVGPC